MLTEPQNVNIAYTSNLFNYANLWDFEAKVETWDPRNQTTNTAWYSQLSLNGTLSTQKKETWEYMSGAVERCFLVKK